MAVIGGGIIGASIAWRLAERGCPVDVFDAGDGALQGRAAATWASAGLLAPGVEAEPTEDALHELCLRSLARWPAFADELTRRTGIALDYRERGALVVALTRDDVRRLEHAYAYHERLGTRQRWLARAEIETHEPELAATVLAARHLPDDRQVDPRAVLTALHALLDTLNVPFHRERVTRVALDGARPAVFHAAPSLAEARVTEAHVTEQRLDVDVIVVAAGAWSRALDGVPDTLRVPVHPVKGQMLAVEMPDARALLRHAVFTPRVYLVPRTSGRLLVGATVEDRGFDDEVTAGGLLHLLDGAWRALPAIEEARVVETWAGLRPGSRDDAPLLGARHERLVYATGHYRNGILLAPVTADAIADTICTERAPEWIRAFAPDRFDPTHPASRRVPGARTADDL